MTNKEKIKIKFQKHSPEDFYAAVKQRVENYFKDEGVSRHANGLMYIKTGILLSLYIGLFALLYSNYLDAVGVILTYFFLGVVLNQIGFNIVHDALHGSYSSNSTINRLLGYLYDINGFSSYVWKISHNVVHHTYTNIPGYDEDIDKSYVLRLSPKDEIHKYHRYQNWYAPFLYCFLTLSWVLYGDYAWYIKENGHRPIPLREKIIFFGFKAANLLITLILPLVLLSAPWWSVVIGYLCMHFYMGISSSIVFQLAHVVEDVAYPEPDEYGNMENRWAIHEMLTTSNFGVGSKLTAYFVGGLNYQVEHHLFPYVCHTHYNQIYKIVRQTAKEYDVPYHTKRDFLEAIKSHFRTLRNLGHV